MPGNRGSNEVTGEIGTQVFVDARHRGFVEKWNLCGLPISRGAKDWLV
jgi:hypothetical protein